MGMKITAEGVENAGQAERLREAGCDFGQGYFYARPAFAERVPWMIRQACASASSPVRRIPSPRLARRRV